MTKKKLSIALLFLLFAIIADAQITSLTDTLAKKKPPLFKSLKKAEPGDLDTTKELMVNPSETPFYYEDFSKLNEMDLIRILSSGNYMPEPYIDSNKVVKAYVLRKSKEEEKKNIQTIKSDTKSDTHQHTDLIGKKALPFSVTDIYGNNFSTEKLKGKVIVLNFWFVECKPCIKEMPTLNKMAAKYKNKDVVFLAFSLNDQKQIMDFLKIKAFNYNIVPVSDDIAGLYHVRIFPTNIIIDKNSTVSYFAAGFDPSVLKEIDKKIETLLK